MRIKNDYWAEDKSYICVILMQYDSAIASDWSALIRVLCSYI